MPTVKIDPKISNPPGFSKQDGTVAFYVQVANLVNEDTILLDLGAGRASWYEDERGRFNERHPRFLKNKVKKVIAVDVDAVVLQNRTAHECYVMQNNRIPLADNTIDVIVADFVLEHIEKPEEFFEEVNRVLRPGGVVLRADTTQVPLHQHNCATSGKRSSCISAKVCSAGSERSGYFSHSVFDEYKIDTYEVI